MPVHTKSLYYLEYQVHRGENEPRNQEQIEYLRLVLAHKRIPFYWQGRLWIL